MCDHLRNPCECEPRVSPLFKREQPGNNERDPAQQFGYPEQNAQLLRISHVRERCCGVGAEPLRIIFAWTQLIGDSRIQERKCAVRQSVKGMRWKDIEGGL